jgi:hypothetical protein
VREEPNGVEEEPKLAVYVRRWHPPGRDVPDIPGAWRLEDGWPPRRSRTETLSLRADHTLGREAGDPGVHTLVYRPSAGAEAGMWWGDLQPDQAPVDMVSLAYDSAPLENDLEILGFPRVALDATTDAGSANWFVRLCDVAPEGSVTLVTGAGAPTPATTGAPDGSVEFDLHVTSWTFERGHRIRLAVSNALWPMIWPTPHRMTATLTVGAGSVSAIQLPVVPPAERQRPLFAEPAPHVQAPGWRSEGDVLPGDWDVRRDGTAAVATWHGASRSEAPWGRSDYRESLEWRVDDLDPAHAGVHGESETTVSTPGREIRWLGMLDITSDETVFDYRYRRQLWLNGEPIREREWHERIPRVDA